MFASVRIVFHSVSMKNKETKQKEANIVHSSHLVHYYYQIQIIY